MSKLRITTILGTRPEIIRLSNMIGKLDAYMSIAWFIQDRISMQHFQKFFLKN